MKRHFQKCSVRRGNPTGENHLSHSRATKKSNLEKAAEASAMATSLPDRTRTIPSTQSTAVTDFAMTNIHTALDFSGLGLGSPGFADDPQSRPNRESRSNSIKQPSIGGLAGNSGNFSASSSSSFDHTGLSYSGGQVTPDSITTSGAATPYQYPNETRPNHFASDATFSHAPQGSGAHLTGSNSRTPSGLHYTNGSLPEIVGSTYNRMSDIDWNSLMAANGGEDYSNPQFHSTFHSSQQPIKSEQDLSHVSFPSPQGYPPFSQPKV